MSPDNSPQPQKAGFRDAVLGILDSTDDTVAEKIRKIRAVLMAMEAADAVTRPDETEPSDETDVTKSIASAEAFASAVTGRITEAEVKAIDNEFSCVVR